MTGMYNKRSHDLAWSLLRSACDSTFLAKTFEISGNVASFARWQKMRGLDNGARYRNRQKLWRAGSGRLRTGKVTVLEFGVAAGDATRAWLSMLNNPELRWHGFDTFTGLPEPWIQGGIRFAEAGAFDAGGSPPDIADSRVTWHTGRVEETLPTASIDMSPPICAIFDLDLYEPSSFALRWLTEHIKPGDLLYFDEAYDPWHERRLLDEFLDHGHHVRGIGSTGMALMLEYVGPPPDAKGTSSP